MPAVSDARVSGQPDTAALASGLRLAVGRLGRLLRRQVEGRALSASLLSALVTLEGHGPLSPTDLAEHERVQKASMTRILASLEELGLVVRRPHPTDRRQAVVEISRGGRAELAQDRRNADAWLSQRLARLSPEQARALEAALPVLRQLSER